MAIVKSTSYSRASLFEKCPLQFKLRYLDKIPSPAPELPDGEEYPMDRGIRLHTLAENYVQNPMLSLPREFFNLERQLNALRELYARGLVELEKPLAFDANWQLSRGDDFVNTRYRMVADVWAMVAPGRLLLVDHKGLATDTEIPTPNGFVTMGDLKVGDIVFDKDGKQCAVTDKSKVKNIDCYKVIFNDGTEVICDHEHLWYTATGETINVRDLKGVWNGRQNTKVPRIPVAGSVEYKKQNLPIHPYILGMWLADGKHSSSEITNPEDFVWDKIESLGYVVNRSSKQTKSCPTYTVQGIRGKLNNLGLLGCGKDKFIPEQYLKGSIKQRMDLLQGLMDGDGSANRKRKQALFCTTVQVLAEQVRNLLASLGQQSYISPFETNGFGVTTKAHYVSFRPSKFNPFSLPRKAKVLEGCTPGYSLFRTAKKVEKIPTVPTQCIAVDSPSRTYLCTRSMVPTHNSGKKKGNEIKHHEQLMEYAISASIVDPDIQIFEMQNWYFDLKAGENIMKKTFTRTQVVSALNQMKARHEKVLSARVFPAAPSHFACLFCDYKAGSVGKGKKAYPGTGHCRRNVC